MNIVARKVAAPAISPLFWDLAKPQIAPPTVKLATEEIIIFVVKDDSSFLGLFSFYDKPLMKWTLVSLGIYCLTTVSSTFLSSFASTRSFSSGSGAL